VSGLGIELDVDEQAVEVSLIYVVGKIEGVGADDRQQTHLAGTTIECVYSLSDAQRGLLDIAVIPARDGFELRE